MISNSTQVPALVRFSQSLSFFLPYKHTILPQVLVTTTGYNTTDYLHLVHVFIRESPSSETLSEKGKRTPSLIRPFTFCLRTHQSPTRPHVSRRACLSSSRLFDLTPQFHDIAISPPALHGPASLCSASCRGHGSIHRILHSAHCV